MNVAIIVAAGRGSRMGGGRAKQFREISGIPIIIHTLSRFERCETIDGSVVVLPEGEREAFAALAGRYGLRKVSGAVAGGETRAASVWRGLQALADLGVEVVAVHDGVRPFVTPEEIDRTVREARANGAAILAAPVTDTIKEADGDLGVRRTLDRASLWAIQTPQAFRREALVEALAQPDDVLAAATDDAWLVERAGGTVRVVESSPDNLKVTTRLDLRVAELLLAERC
jgi:2-C-methyl-D-erythritol 4-phosphate cytidylyltransferase